MRKRFNGRTKTSVKFQLPEGEVLNYKNLSIIQKFLNDRGKLLPRRITGLSAKQQRALTTAVKRARFLALLSTGGVR